MYEDTNKREFDWKGFLLKLAFVIVVIVLIVKLLPLNNKKNNTSTELSSEFKTNLGLLKEAGSTYFTNDKLPTDEGDSVKINLSDLVQIGAVRTLTDKNGKSCDGDGSYVKATKKAKEYELEVHLICSKEESTTYVYLGCYGDCETTTTTTKTTKPTTTTKTNSSNSSTTTKNNNGGVTSSKVTTTRIITSIITTTTTPPTKYVVIFNSSGGSSVPAQYVSIGQVVFKPADPVKEGYTFVKWEYANAEYDFTKQIQGNMILIAVWAPKNGGSSVTTKTTTTTKHITTSSYYPITTTTTKTTTTKANTVYYNVTFDPNGGVSTSGVQTIQNGGRVTQPLDPVRTNYTFIGWYYNGIPYDFNKLVNNNMVLVAQWVTAAKTSYTVTFDYNNGNNATSKSVNSGDTVAKPANPTRISARFIAWYHNGKLFDFSTKITSNITLVARYYVTEALIKDVYTAGWSTQTTSFKVSHKLNIPAELNNANTYNIKLESPKYVRSLNTATDIANYSKYHAATFDYIGSSADFTSTKPANMAVIDKATFVLNDRQVTWTGNVSKQCTTPFSYLGMNNLCGYGIVYRVTWYYEVIK